MVSVLVDNSVMNHAVAIKHKRIATGTVLWGGVVPDETYTTVSVRAGHQIRKSKGGEQTLFIVSLARAFMASQHVACQTDALKLERFHVPVSRYTGFTYGDESLFKYVEIENALFPLNGFSFSIPGDDPLQKFRQYLENVQDMQYVEIKKALESAGSKDRTSQDAWHLYSAKTLGLKFVSCDTKLKDQIRSIADRRVRQALSDVYVLPSELCDELGLSKASDEEFDELSRQVSSLAFQSTTP